MTVTTEIRSGDITSKVSDIAELAIGESTGLFLVEACVRGRQGSRVVEVYIDGDEGVAVQELARVSRRMAEVLESEDIIKGKYHLNVSSPGPERALLKPRQFRKHIGRVLELTLDEGTAEEIRKLKGKLLSISDKGIELQQERRDSEFVEFDRLGVAEVVMPW